MDGSSSNRRVRGFTLVELLLSLALGVLVAGILAALLHGLLSAGEGQSRRLQGPYAAQDALRTLSREISCAFAPPVPDLPPVELSTSTEPGKPDVRLAFYATVPAEAAWPGAYDLRHVAIEMHRTGDGICELRRIAAPCSGPGTNAPVTNILLSGRFTLTIEAAEADAPDTFLPEWPLPEGEVTRLPVALRLSLGQPDEPPLRTEVLIQAASEIPSPVSRETVETEP